MNKTGVLVKNDRVPQTSIPMTDKQNKEKTKNKIDTYLGVPITRQRTPDMNALFGAQFKHPLCKINRFQRKRQ